MPKRLKIWPSQRLDLDDFDYQSFQYSLDLVKLNNKFINSNIPSFVSGFKIRVADQVATPGQIELFNGLLLDGLGNVVTNEDSVNASQTTTLLGSNQTFYLEIELATTNSDVDNRAFWDANYDNGVGNLKGKEFIGNTTTRTTQSWTIVSPINNSGFELTSNPNSSKIPLAIIKTDSVGRITTAVNTGMVLAPASTVSVQSANAGDTWVSIQETAHLPSPNFTVQITDGTNTETMTVGALDRVNRIMYFTLGLSNSYKSGAFIQDQNSTRVFIKSRTSSTIEATGLTSTHPDKKIYLFSGDEDRGAALSLSPDTFNSKDDLNIKNLADYVDFLSSQIRELKIGTNRFGVPVGDSSYPTSNFSQFRYYSQASSIIGSKQATYTIGDGINTIGDFNGTTHVPFNNAIAAAVTAGYTSVRLFVKRGTYSCTSPISCSIATIIEGETSYLGAQSVVIQNVTNSSNLFTVSVNTLQLINLRMTHSNTSSKLIECTDSSTSHLYLTISKCYIPQISGTGISYAFSNVLKVSIEDSWLVSTNNTGSFISVSTGTLSGHIKNTVISSTNSGLLSSLITANSSNKLLLEKNEIEYNGVANAITFGNSTDLDVSKCVFTNSGPGSTSNSLGFAVSIPLSNLRVSIKDCRIVNNGSNNYTKFINVGSVENLCISDNYLNNTSANSGLGLGPIHITVSSTLKDAVISGNQITVTYSSSNSGENSSAIGIIGSTIINCNIFANRITTSRSAIGISIKDCNHDSLNITDNSIAGGVTGVLISGSVEPPDLNNFFPSINIKNNTYNGKGTLFNQVDHFGINCISLRGYTVLNIVGNTVENLYGNTSATGIQVSGFDLSGLGSAAGTPVVNILGNTLSRIYSASLGAAIASNSTSSRMNIKDNNISHITGSLASGINVANALFSNIMRNNISYLLGTTGASSLIAIYSLLQNHTNISDNTVTNLDGASSIISGSIYGIYCIGLPSRISNNSIVTHYGASGMSASSAIKLEGSCNNSVVMGNQLLNVGLLGIEVNVASGALSGVTVNDNFVSCGAQTACAIVITGVSGDTIHNTRVNSNNIVNYSGGISSGAISFVNCDNISASNNNIKESSSPVTTTHAAFLVDSCISVSLSGNSVYGTTTTSAVSRRSVRLIGTDKYNFTGNRFFWHTQTNVASTEMSLGASTNGSIVGNDFLGSDLHLGRYAIDFGTSSNTLLMSNNFIGASITSAQINIGSATGVAYNTSTVAGGTTGDLNYSGF